jgi:hypothetical protein
MVHHLQEEQHIHKDKRPDSVRVQGVWLAYAGLLCYVPRDQQVGWRAAAPEHRQISKHQLTQSFVTAWQRLAAATAPRVTHARIELAAAEKQYRCDSDTMRAMQPGIPYPGGGCAVWSRSWNSAPPHLNISTDTAHCCRRRSG